jgi:hypothetical protein
MAESHPLGEQEDKVESMYGDLNQESLLGLEELEAG